MERSEAYWILHNMWGEANEEQREALSIAQRDIEFVDLMDDRFTPVKHGRWIFDDYTKRLRCSECEAYKPYEVVADYIDYWDCDYCHKCGADMRGDGK